MGICLSCCPGSSSESELLQPDLETKRRQQAEAAEKRLKDAEGRGVKNPQRLQEKQRKLEELQQKEEEAAKHGNTGGGLKKNDNDEKEEDIILAELRKRHAALFNGTPPEEEVGANIEGPRLSVLAALEIRLQKLEEPLGVECIEEEDEANKSSDEEEESLRNRLRALGSGSNPQPCDMGKLEAPKKRKDKKKAETEEAEWIELQKRFAKFQELIQSQN